MLSMAKRQISKSSSSSEIDPLLGDLSEKKQNFRLRVSSLAAELRDVSSQLASKEGDLARETLMKEAAEMKAKRMEEDVARLCLCLEERNGQLVASTSVEEKYQKYLDDIRSQLANMYAAMDASAASALAVESYCLSLKKELDEKSNLLNMQEVKVCELEHKLEILMNDCQAMDMIQEQLRDNILKLERDLMSSIVEAADSKDVELRKCLNEVSAEAYLIFNKQLETKDEEITRLRSEVRLLSSISEDNEQYIQSQLDKHHMAENEMMKKVMKLEFSLQELRSQTRKLQRMEEKRDDTLKELRYQLPMKPYKILHYLAYHNLWESSGLKFVFSVSMFVLVLFTKR